MGGVFKMKFYTVQEVADSLNVHPNTIRNWINSGDLKSYKLGNTLRISKEDLEKFLEKNKQD
jgi:excisionase family DNA binding protein